MVSLIKILLVSLLLTSAMTEITVNNHLKDLQITAEDVVDFDLERIFDLSKANGELHFSSNVGHVYNRGDVFASLSLSDINPKLDTPNWVQSHGEWITAVYNYDKVFFARVNASGRDFKKEVHYVNIGLGKLGSK